mgnify:CR=1 FL=1
MVNQDKTIDQIYDLFAVRILVDTVKDCYAHLASSMRCINRFRQVQGLYCHAEAKYVSVSAYYTDRSERTAV